MQKYELEIKRNKQGHLVKISEKQHNLWIAIGSFEIIGGELFLEDKHEYWRKASDLTDFETLFAMSIAQFQYFFAEATKSFHEIPSGEKIPIYYVYVN